MYLVQILLPLCNNEGRAFPAALFKVVKSNLSNRFQGLTAYSRAAAEGLWRIGQKWKQDDIVVYEIMADSLDAKWWKDYRVALEKMFDQDSVIIRAQRVRIL